MTAEATIPKQPRPLRGLRITLLVLTIVQVVATAGFLTILFAPGAIVTLLGAMLTWALLTAVEFRRGGAPITGRRPAPARPAGGPPTASDIDADEGVAAARRHLGVARVVLVITGVVAVSAIVLAAILSGWRIIGLVALLFFAMMAFMGVPVWAAAMKDTEEAAGD